MVIELSNAQASVQIAPDLGASLLSYSLRDGRQILRPTPDSTDAFQTACYLLIPWCNRIDDGITLPDGTRQRIAQTHPDHPLAIHGSGALSEWNVEAKTQESVTLSCVCDWPKPFHYRAEVQYALHGDILSVVLTVTHLGDAPLPYGIGLHPWFVRTDKTRLLAKADTWQQTDARQLPVGDATVSAANGNDFNTLQQPPNGLIDTAFSGWNGTARLQIDDDLSVTITTEPSLQHYQVYSTGADADFVCFEPVCHPINAHNTPGHPGLAVLDHGETLTIAVTLTPEY
ncbi:MAG: aldose 1-epimerase [Pseudomonadota bacterium]